MNAAQLSLASLLLLLAAAPAAAQTAPAGKDGWTQELSLALHGGAYDGLGAREVAGGFAEVEAKLTPELRLGVWRLSLPLALDHVQRFGHEVTPAPGQTLSLNETRGEAGVRVENRAHRLVRWSLAGSVFGARKADWPDLYQRNAAGEYRATDRYGFLAWDAGAGLWLQPAAKQFLRLDYRYARYDFAEDPNYDPLADPNHLTPGDRDLHRFEMSWRILSDAYLMAFELATSRQESFDQLARDAGTGSTHYATNPNPSQVLVEVEPSVEVQLRRLGGRAEVSFRYGYELQSDTFQGSYSYGWQNPRLAAAVDLTERLSGDLRVEAWLREYGPDSKNPAALEDGQGRWDRRGEVRARLRYALAGSLSLVGQAQYVVRSTNYPDYVPGVYPAPPRDEFEYYDIGWDFTNVAAFVGVEYRR